MKIAYTWPRAPGDRKTKAGLGVWGPLHQISTESCEELGPLAGSAFLHTSWVLYVQVSGGCFVWWLTAAQRVGTWTRECRMVVNEAILPGGNTSLKVSILHLGSSKLCIEPSSLCVLPCFSSPHQITFSFGLLTMPVTEWDAHSLTLS